MRLLRAKKRRKKLKVEEIELASASPVCLSPKVNPSIYPKKAFTIKARKAIFTGLLVS